MSEVAGLGAEAVLAAAVACRRTADRAEADLLALAGHWADLHAVLPGGDAAGFRSEDRTGALAGGVLAGGVLAGGERMLPLAGDGTPQVAEFAPGELGAALRMTSYAAAVLIGDALELRHRLPRLWARVQAGQLQAWRARQVAEHTKSLSRPAAAFVDAQLAPVAHKIGLRRVLALVEVALRRFDPDTAAAREQQRAEGRGVWCSETMTDGTRSVHIEADALDVEVFDAQLDTIAEALARLGDPDRKNVRRAKAVGVIADPQGTLDLLHHTTPDTTTPDTPRDAASPDTSRPGTPSRTARPATSPRAARPGGGRPRVLVYLHLSETAVAARSGTARVEDLGPLSLDLVQAWLHRSDIVLRPVLDLDNRVAVDAYETPDAIRETVLLRNPCCPFPWCTNLSRRKDMDHLVPYLPPEDGGPPGQTAAHLLGAPCRRHHRYKTFGGWSYTMPEPGIYLWRSPLGRRYLVDHTGTAHLDQPHCLHPTRLDAADCLDQPA